MNAYLILQNNSSQSLPFSVSGVPSGVGITNATWMIKNSYTDVDSNALVTVAITASQTASGQITDNGATSGTGQLNFVLGNLALNGIDDYNQTYFGVCKIELANGLIYELAAARQPVRVLA